jgi:uncharacterized protein YbbC (DUF1343 family)
MKIQVLAKMKWLFFFLCIKNSILFSQVSALSGYMELPQPEKKIITGAEQIIFYDKFLKGKRVGMVINHTSVLGRKNTLLVDSLLKRKIKVVKIFAPEHGFRGTADAGEKVNSQLDKTTGLPIISLYGNHKKPSKEDLSGIDIMVFDMQDVGVRFYTYISTLHYIMEACAEQNIPLLVLDRPNPNGHYVDGPVLDLKFQSFVGMHPIPVVHGLTIGELARMINGEKWLDSGRVCDLRVIHVKNYTHKRKYVLPVKPSPNLPNAQSILLYPSLCLFEGTNISVGRGTDKPFQIYGSPDSLLGKYTFVPKSVVGAKKPLYENQKCYGRDLSKSNQRFTLDFLIEAYKNSSQKDVFFNNFFTKLIGNNTIQQQIQQGLQHNEIAQTWQKSLNEYKLIRKKYLIYKDFE